MDLTTFNKLISEAHAFSQGISTVNKIIAARYYIGLLFIVIQVYL